MIADRGELAAGLQFILRLPAVLRSRISHEQALALVRQRLERRADDFLWLLREAVYGQASHPSHRLLQRAGCAFGDVVQLVRADGVEGALQTLYRAGVYLTADEVAGRSRVIRGGDSFAISQADLRNPWSAAHMIGTSGGSRSGTPTAVALDLDALFEQFPVYRLALVAAGGEDWLDAIWAPPGSIGLAYAVRGMVNRGRPPDRWFSPVDPADKTTAGTYKWGLRSARLAGLLVGARLPSPEYADPVDLAPVIDWLESVRQRGRIPLLSLYPSTAVRLCASAVRRGRDLHGVRLSLRGEPVTPARVAVAQALGAEVSSLYGAIECGAIGHSCLRPAAADEVHVHDDLHAIIQPGSDAAVSGLPADALLITALRRSARLILLNACLGDQAMLDQRSCGCGLEAYGWRTHLRGIHSFEKLTGMGMTFADAEVTPVLEQVLPARFGGAPTDYQLIEEESGDGGIRLRLVVDPRLGPLDEEAVIETFLDALARISPTRKMMTLSWRAAAIVRIDRSRPLSSPSGKIMHFRRADARDEAPH